MARKVPSFTGLKPASIVSSLAKRNNTSRNTIHELILRCKLSRNGLRFRKNVETLPGKPDIVFPGSRVVIFCDGDFWHGRNWKKLRSKLQNGTNAPYWLAKIAANIKRDLRNTALLKKSGWQVVRLWETDIKRDPSAAANHIKKVIYAQRAKLRAKIEDNNEVR